MPSRLFNELYQDKEWSFNDLSAKEQAAYREKERAFSDIRIKREKLEEDWRKGKIPTDTYSKLDRKYADQERKLLYPEKFNKKGGAKVAYAKGRKKSKVKGYSYGQRNAYVSGKGYAIAYNDRVINFTSPENKAAFRAGFRAGVKKIKANPRKYSSLFKKKF